MPSTVLVINPDFQSASSSVSLYEAHVYLSQLDLSYIIEMMCSDRHPLPRWTYPDAEFCCQLYKNYLFLIKKYLPMPLVPTREIDEFWHNHILYTRNYLKDCLHIFGHYLHHDPASPNEEPEKLIEDFLRTKQLYLEEFKQALEVMARL